MCINIPPAKLWECMSDVTTAIDITTVQHTQLKCQNFPDVCCMTQGMHIKNI